MNEKEILEKTYENPGAVWTTKEPPKELIELIERGKIKPCKCLDMGCGEGFYAIYLASKGFDVTGIDLSKNAINHAKQNAKKRNVEVKFKELNLKNLDKINEKFDFILEWSIMHFIPFNQRKKYVKDIKNLLNKKGKYLSFCFNRQDPKFGEGKKIRIVPKKAKTIPGAKLYFSSLEELKDLFKPYFKIIEGKILKKIRVGGINVWNYFFMEKLK